MKPIVYLILILIVLSSCSDSSELESSSSAVQITSTGENEVVRHAEWSVNSTIYEVNIRQHTPEGTFSALTNELSKISRLGVQALKLNPVQPIGVVNRKASSNTLVHEVLNLYERKRFLGNPYSISDYTSVNPQLGTAADFEDLVSSAHDLGMKVILDWDAGHTSHDHNWIKNGFSDWYIVDSLNIPQSPNPYSRDVVTLNFQQDSMRLAMIEAMKYWVLEYDIDGFNCEFSREIPLEFWEELSGELQKVKSDIFMISNAEVYDHHQKAFDLSYGNRAYQVISKIATGAWPIDSIDSYLMWEEEKFSTNDLRLIYLTNHMVNSQVGPLSLRLEKNMKPAAVLAFTFYGMPMLYSGQEYGNNKALKEFEKDTIVKNDPQLFDFYKTLVKTKTDNEALWNGSYGGRFTRITSSNDSELLCFKRTKNDNEIITVVNLSEQKQQVNFVREIQGVYQSVFNDETLNVYTSGTREIEPHGYQVFIKQ